MALKISSDCWSRWEAVIKHISAEYDFPASSEVELNLFLRMFSGNGSTFRTKKNNWKFVIDVTRRGDIIVDIVAITLTARPGEDPRCNGAVITRACDIHPDPDGAEYVGAPQLRWVMVTSGGMSFQHCCDKECSEPDKFHDTPRLRINWETARLKIIQKAYEQEVLALREHNNTHSEQQVANLHQRLEDVSRSLAKSRESKGKWKRVARMREKEYTEVLEANDIMHHNLFHRDKTMQKELAEMEDMMEESTLEEKRQLIEEAQTRSAEEIRTLEQVNEKMREEREAMEKRLRNLKKINGELEKGRESDKQNLQVLSDSNNGLKERIKYLENKSSYSDTNNDGFKDIKDLSYELKTLEKNIEILKLAHKKETSSLKATVNLLNEANSKLDAGKQSIQDNVSNLEVKIKTMEAEAKHSGNTITKLESELQLKNDDNFRMKAALDKAHKGLHEKVLKCADDTAEFKREMREKDEYTRRLQNELQYTQQTVLNLHRNNLAQQAHHPPDAVLFPPQPAGFAQELENQRNISRQAHERANDLQSKLDATVIEMEAKISELHDIKKTLSEQSAAVLDLEKKCVDYVAQIACLRVEKDAAVARATELDKFLKSQTARVNQEIECRKQQARELEEKCAEKVAASIDIQKKCSDNEAYTANLEKKLEELRGTMESVLQGVSIHQGRKRRRTEGPDFQL